MRWFKPHHLASRMVQPPKSLSFGHAMNGTLYHEERCRRPPSAICPSNARTTKMCCQAQAIASWLTVTDSFPEVAYLKAVCWLEVQGQMECTVPCGSYTLSWRLSLAETPVRRQSYIHHALGHVYGWSHKPVIFTLAVDDDDQHAEAQHYLDADCWERERAESSQRYGRRMVDDKWMEFDVGQFVVEEGEKNSGVGRVKLQYSLIEIKGGHWKSGMFVDGVVIRPSHLKPMCLLDRYVREHSGGSSSEPVPSRSSLPAKLGEVYINDES